MEIELKFNKDFERALNGLRDKYGEDFEILNGIHNSQMNFSDFIDAFIDKNMADVTIDSNANASNKDIASFRNEKGKSIDKIIAANKIFYELKKKYGLKTAKEWLETEYTGGFYLHDFPSTTYVPYCYAYDLTRLANEGLFFLKNYNAQPPKHLTTFIDDVIEFISFMSNRSSGAVGIPNVLVWTFYFWKKDCTTNFLINNPDYYLRQSFQKLIYRLNQPFMRIDQSAFVNVSIFDRSYYESLFGGLEFPDGTFAIDYVDEFIEHQKTFMEVVSKIRSENMFTFPVLSYSLLYKDGKFVDEDFAKWCCKHNCKWNDANFFVSGDVTTLSNCPLDAQTNILYWSERYGEFKLSPIKQVYSNNIRDGIESIKVLSNGKIINCKINKFDIPAEYEIELVNGETIKTTASHLNKVYGKDYIETKNLTSEDYLPYGRHVFDMGTCMSYEDGYLVGMFLGDGSYRDEHDIVFSLNVDTDQDAISFLHTYCKDKFNAKVTEFKCMSQISGNRKCNNVSVNSDMCRGLICQFINGDNALNKRLNYRFLTCSKEFRQGIVDGLYKTDGGNSNRIYTSSQSMVESLKVLFSSLGIVVRVDTDERENRLSTNPCYTVRWYDPNLRKSFKDIYIVDDDYFWVKIKSIKRLEGVGQGSRSCSYCLEVIDKDAEPIFTLGNGVITHNCRLLSDTSKLKGFINSIGGTALSIGSVKVNTINLVHIFYELGESVTEIKYLNLLKKRTTLCCKTLDVVRGIIKRNIEKGLLPNYTDGGIEMDKQYCTCGILGLYEVMQKFGYINTDEFGNKYYTNKGIEFSTKIFDILNDVKDNFTDEYSFNIESVPAERAAVNLCAKDNSLFDVHDDFIYSNQWIPLTEKCTINEKIRTSAILDNKCSGGAIAHINIDNNFANEDMAWNMLNYIASKGVIYFCYNSKINICKNHHGFIGTNICPECNEPTVDTYQRVVGFLTPSKSYSKERFKEFSARQWYDTGKIYGETSMMGD